MPHEQRIGNEAGIGVAGGVLGFPAFTIRFAQFEYAATQELVFN